MNLIKSFCIWFLFSAFSFICFSLVFYPAFYFGMVALDGFGLIIIPMMYTPVALGLGLIFFFMYRHYMNKEYADVTSLVLLQVFFISTLLTSFL